MSFDIYCFEKKKAQAVWTSEVVAEYCVVRNVLRVFFIYSLTAIISLSMPNYYYTHIKIYKKI